ncbi:MAG: hypothetical protein OEZ10_00380 [Gammaproteobacteria bacterium]|nr:hypothetical protein [Gammaproteobacteria bacterium]
MTKFLRLIMLVLLFSIAVGAQAEEWQGPDDVLRAAKAGDADAQLEMGILYEYGFFLSENKAPALAWYSLAAEQGNIKAAKLRDKLQTSMSPAEVDQAEQLKSTLAVAPQAPPESAASETGPETAPEQAPTTPVEVKQ